MINEWDGRYVGWAVIGIMDTVTEYGDVHTEIYRGEIDVMKDIELRAAGLKCSAGHYYYVSNAATSGYAGDSESDW